LSTCDQGQQRASYCFTYSSSGIKTEGWDFSDCDKLNCYTDKGVDCMYSSVKLYSIYLLMNLLIKLYSIKNDDRLCGLVVRVSGN